MPVDIRQPEVATRIAKGQLLMIEALDRGRLTVRAPRMRTGIAAADLSQIRSADLGRFTADRLITVASDQHGPYLHPQKSP